MTISPGEHTNFDASDQDIDLTNSHFEKFLTDVQKKVTEIKTDESQFETETTISEPNSLISPRDSYQNPGQSDISTNASDNSNSTSLFKTSDVRTEMLDHVKTLNDAGADIRVKKHTCFSCTSVSNLFKHIKTPDDPHELCGAINTVDTKNETVKTLLPNNALVDISGIQKTYKITKDNLPPMTLINTRVFENFCKNNNKSFSFRKHPILNWGERKVAVHGPYEIFLKLDGIRVFTPALVVPDSNLKEEILVGADLLQLNGIFGSFQIKTDSKCNSKGGFQQKTN